MACCGEGVQLLCSRKGGKAGAKADQAAAEAQPPKAEEESKVIDNCQTRVPLSLPLERAKGNEEAAADGPLTATTLEPVSPPDSPTNNNGSQFLAPITEEARAAAAQPGRALAERLRISVEARMAKRTTITLQEVRGFTGLYSEGFLSDQTELAACCTGGKTGPAFYAVKGPWMLKFPSDAPTAKAAGVPIPLDGARILTLDENEFEIRNVHVKADFYGKEALRAIPGFAKDTFEHDIIKQFAAPSAQKRDEWVELLKAQVQKLQERLARKIQQPSTRNWTAGSTGTIASVNKLAVALFAQYETEEEERELHMCETVGVPRVTKCGVVHPGTRL